MKIVSSLKKFKNLGLMVFFVSRELKNLERIGSEIFDEKKIKTLKVYLFILKRPQK